jgi:hypothetical protein
VVVAEAQEQAAIVAARVAEAQEQAAIVAARVAEAIALATEA